MAGKKGVPFHKGKPFKKGEVRNPGGRPAIPPEIKAFQKLTYQDFIDSLQRMGSMPRKEIADLVKQEDTPSFQIIFGKVMIQATEGNLKAVDLLFTRLWGKPKEVDAEIIPDLGPKVEIYLPDNLRDRIVEVEAKS